MNFLICNYHLKVRLNWYIRTAVSTTFETKSSYSVLYLLTAEKLNGHIAEVNCQTESMLDSIVTSLGKQENITEQMKANRPMEWVQKMNSIRS